MSILVYSLEWYSVGETWSLFDMKTLFIDKERLKEHYISGECVADPHPPWGVAHLLAADPLARGLARLPDAEDIHAHHHLPLAETHSRGKEALQSKKLFHTFIVDI